MNRTWLIAACVSLGIASTMVPASGQDNELYRTHMVDISVPGKATALAVVDGKLYFRALTASAHEGPTIAVQSLMFWRKDQTLQALIGRGQGMKLKEQAALHLWYLTADYSTDPPRVGLTEKAGKYSQWIFESRTGRPRSTVNYIRNANDLGKPAWLVVGKTAKYARFQGDTKAIVALLDPVLTFDREKKQLFDIRPYNGPESK